MTIKNKKIIWFVALIVAVAVLIVCGVQLVGQAVDISNQKKMDEELGTIAWKSPEPSVAPTLAPTATAPIESPEPTVSTEPSVPQEIDFTALQNQNDEIFSWIHLDGTQIDYPVLCRPQDDTYYHYYNVKHEKVIAASIYIQGSLNSMDWTDFHTVLYGHNMRNGSMFGDLHEFEDQTFFDEHDTVVIYTPTQKLTYTIFAAYKRDNKHLLKYYLTDSVDGRQAFIDDIFTHAGFFREDVELTTDSNIITMSTCVGGQKDKRYVVQAVLTKEQPVILSE